MTVGAERSAIERSRYGRVYDGENLRHVAMPLGGLGAGQIALGGDGGLRQWQMVNQVNHLGFVPDSFFSIRSCSVEPPLNITKILQSQERIKMGRSHTPLINDDYIPEDQRTLLERFSGVQRTTFTGEYPFARVGYEDVELPLEVELEAYSPFVPLDAETSGLPAIVFTFRIRNQSEHKAIGCLGATLQNAVGWDGITPISGNRCPLYGGNTNRVHRRGDHTAIIMDNPSLSEDHPGAGQMVLSALTPGTMVYEQWSSSDQFMRFMEGFSPISGQGDPNSIERRNLKNKPNVATGPSAAGETWNGGLLTPYRLDPGEETSITFIIGWHFPNRYVNFDQFGSRRNYGKSRFWVGNAYAARFSDAVEVVEHVIRNRHWMEDKSRAWTAGIYGSTLPEWISEALAAQGSLMRSPTCFWSEDSKFYGFEGSLGASTDMSLGAHGGSCPLNCTHVWNYEQALSKLFPELEQTMRETEFDHVQSPEGYVPHRTVLPLYLPQFWDEPIGGPTNPALDGMLGTVLKVYREIRQGAGHQWLAQLWPGIKKLVTYIRNTWDQDDDGVLRGEQPNTFDIAFYGPNMFIGGLWLATLRAAEEMAKLHGEIELAQELRELFERGSAHYDQLLWNGEYYVQLLDQPMLSDNQFGDGCLSDQLLGQWWAHLLELGYILPEERVRITLQSIVEYNFCIGFEDFKHKYREFATGNDSGLLVCTWPHGGRPEVPVRYCDEVWTGTEYHVGAHCIMEGLLAEGNQVLSALRERYDGVKRNPYNEVECGDHYARAMSGWSILEAISGFRYNALEDALSFAPINASHHFECPFVVASGWGTFKLENDAEQARVILSCIAGEIRIGKLSLPSIFAEELSVFISGKPVRPKLCTKRNLSLFDFEEAVTLSSGDSLEVIGDSVNRNR